MHPKTTRNLNKILSYYVKILCSPNDLGVFFYSEMCVAKMGFRVVWMAFYHLKQNKKTECQQNSPLGTHFLYVDWHLSSSTLKPEGNKRSPLVLDNMLLCIMIDGDVFLSTSWHQQQMMTDASDNIQMRVDKLGESM